MDSVLVPRQLFRDVLLALNDIPNQSFGDAPDKDTYQLAAELSRILRLVERDSSQRTVGVTPPPRQTPETDPPATDA